MSTAASMQTAIRARVAALRPRSAIAPRRLLAIAAAALTAVALAACGSADKPAKGGTYAGISGAGAPYLSVGPLVYEVQISRNLNPNDTEDSAFLMGLSPKQRELHAGEEWFGVFMQVYNETGSAHEAAREITVRDTEGNVYKPVEPNEYNLYAYRPGATVPAKDQLPLPSSTAASGAANGLLLLYRIKLTSLENRPLTVKIVSPSEPSDTASAELDS